MPDVSATECYDFVPLNTDKTIQNVVLVCFEAKLPYKFAKAVTIMEITPPAASVTEIGYSLCYGIGKPRTILFLVSHFSSIH